MSPAVQRFRYSRGEDVPAVDLGPAPIVQSDIHHCVIISDSHAYNDIKLSNIIFAKQYLVMCRATCAISMATLKLSFAVALNQVISL